MMALVEAIRGQSGISCAYTNIDPIPNQDGGAPGGNIRVGYLYNPQVLRLQEPNPGGSNDSHVVLPGPELKFNPGRIDPLNAAWTAKRKPIAAAWETVNGRNKFFTVNVQYISVAKEAALQLKVMQGHLSMAVLKIECCKQILQQ